MCQRLRKSTAEKMIVLLTHPCGCCNTQAHSPLLHWIHSTTPGGQAHRVRPGFFLSLPPTGENRLREVDQLAQGAEQMKFKIAIAKHTGHWLGGVF